MDTEVIDSPLGAVTVRAVSPRYASGHFTLKHPTAGTTYEFTIGAVKQWGDEFDGDWVVKTRKVDGDAGFTHFFGSKVWGDVPKRIKHEVVPRLVTWANEHPQTFRSLEIERLQQQIASTEESLHELRAKLAAITA